MIISNQKNWFFFVNFCKKDIVVSKSSPKKLFEKFKLKDESSDINYLLIKVREDSFYNTIINKLPLGRFT